MGINPPLGDRPTDSYDHYKLRLEAIERERHDSGNGSEPPEKKPYLAAVLLEWARKAVDFLLRITDRSASSSAEVRIRENLLQLKSFFEILKKEDRSQDVPFLNQLSQTWHHTLENSLRLKRESAASSPFRSFLRDIQRYPPGAEHSFAYYLTEYTGQEWLPFPYMELIQKIHIEHQLQPTDSALNHWTQAIDQILELLIQE